MRPAWLPPLVLLCLAAACSGTEDSSLVPPGAGSSGSPPSDAAATPDATAPPTEEDAAAPDADADVDAAVDASAPPRRSSGCGLAASPGKEERTMQIAGQPREVWRVVPANYDPSRAYGLVVVLHGSGGSAQTARTKFELETAAHDDYVFLYPTALPDAESGQNRWATEQGSVDYQLFDAMVAEAEAELCIDRERKFVSGFSLGARFTSMLGCYRGDTLRAIAPGAPGMNAESLPLAAGPCVGEVGAWVFWGTQDEDHEEGAKLVRDYYAERNGCTTPRQPTLPGGCGAYPGCRPEAPVVWCTYDAGHVWWPESGATGVMGFFDTFE